MFYSVVCTCLPMENTLLLPFYSLFLLIKGKIFLNQSSRVIQLCLIIWLLLHNFDVIPLWSEEYLAVYSLVFKNNFSVPCRSKAVTAFGDDKVLFNIKPKYAWYFSFHVPKQLHVIFHQISLDDMTGY